MTLSLCVKGFWEDWTISTIHTPSPDKTLTTNWLTCGECNKTILLTEGVIVTMHDCLELTSIIFVSNLRRIMMLSILNWINKVLEWRVIERRNVFVPIVFYNKRFICKLWKTNIKCSVGYSLLQYSIFCKSIYKCTVLYMTLTNPITKNKKRRWWFITLPFTLPTDIWK